MCVKPFATRNCPDESLEKRPSDRPVLASPFGSSQPVRALPGVRYGNFVCIVGWRQGDAEAF
jgi:hypothetical protein